MDKHTAMYIIAAQAASDGGKYGRIDNSVFHEWFMLHMWNDVNHGYRYKDINIMRAINRIVAGGGEGFRFSVVIDTEKVAKYIVYFSYKLEGHDKQISFHSFDKRLERFVKSSKQTSWRNRQDSRANAIELLKSFR